MQAIGKPASWVFHVDAEGEYVVAVPDGATTHRGDSGHSLIVRDARTVVAVAWFAAPDPVDEEPYLEEYVDLVVSSLPRSAERIHRREIAAALFPAREVRYADGFYDRVVRVSLVPGRLYVQSIGLPSFDSYGPEIRAFFDSFTPFVDCPTPATPAPEG